MPHSPGHIEHRSRHDVILLLTIIFLLQAYAQDFGSEYCALTPHHVRVEPDADVTIGAVLPIHNPGEGVYGCGNPTPDGVQVYEAMRWAVDVLNRKSGLISENDGTGGGSLIPGVKIGLKVYDDCGHSALAVEHLTSLFPVLRSGPKSCDTLDKNSTLTIGIIDMSQASSQPEVSESLRDYLIPSIQLSLTTLVPSERMAQILLSATKDLRWSNIVILHEDEEYSISVTKQLTQAAAAGGATCIGNIHSLPRVSAGPKSNRRDLRPYRRSFRAATAGLPHNAAIIVITRNGEAITRFLQVMAEFPEIARKSQWLFSWIPPPAPLSGLKNIIYENSRIYSIAPYPDKVLQFEEYWLSLSRTALFSNQQDRWFLEYLMAQKGCKVPGPVDVAYRNLPLCLDRNIEDTPIEALLRTSRAIPALTSIFTLATAFHKAWESKCQNKAGICPELRAMMRKEFVAQFLEPVEFLVGRENADSAKEETNRRSPRQTSDKLEGSKLSLSQYVYSEDIGIHFKQVLVYESQGSRVLDHDFVSVPSQCSSAGCRGCVRPRQSRLDDDLQSLESRSSLTVESQEVDITIPLLLPLHKAGLSPLECGTVLNAEAVQNLEAALWTVDRINEDHGFLSGAKLGIKVIDTCSSSLMATQKLATYVTSSSNDFMSSLIFVSGSSTDETLAANTVLKPLNISLMSTSDLTPYMENENMLGLANHLLQVPSPVTTKVLAALEVFVDLGWKFVSVINDDTPLHSQAFRIFMQAAKQKGICVGQQFQVHSQDFNRNEVDQIIHRLIDAKSQGSRAVVLLTNEDTTRTFTTGLGRFMEANALNQGDLIMISLGVGAWKENLNFSKGLEKVTLGSLVFKQEHGEVSEFSNHYRHLISGTSSHNTWFEQLIQQEQTVIEGENSANNTHGVDYIPSQSTTNTIQAIVALAAGIASLRNELCQADMGLCPAMKQHNQLQQLIGKHVLSSLSPRLDQPGQTFRFSKKGYGDAPIEVYNFRKTAENGYNFLKVGYYAGHYMKLSTMVVYTSKGETPMDVISSQCIRDCFRCQQTSANHIVIPSSQDLYIAVTLGVHEAAPNPLACGPLKPTQGFQNFESLLWAIDTINTDPGILPGTELGLIVFDTCDSREKAAMDVSNFITGTFEERSTIPSPQHVIGFLAEGPGEVVRPLVDLTMPMGISTVVSTAITPEFNDAKKFPHLLRMNMPSSIVIESIVTVLRYFHWKYVSVVYAEGIQDFVVGEEAFKEFKRQTEEHGIEIAVAEKISADEDIAPTMDIIAHRLKIKQNAGSRAVVLLLPSLHIGHLLDAVKRLQHLGRSRIGDFFWVAYESLEPFQMFPDQSVGALVLSSKVQTIQGFKDYFTSLDINKDSRNPWLRDYWEQIFNCRGSSCCCDQQETLEKMGVIMDRSVPKTVNSLFTLALGLDSLERHLCPDSRGRCSAMKNHLIVREKLFDYAKKIRFTGLDGTPIRFGEKNYVNGKLDLYNFRDIGDVRAFINVGAYDEMNGLTVNTTLARGLDERGEEVSLVQIPSSCNDSETCPQKFDSQPMNMPFMKIPANQEFVIGVMIPVHQPGDNFFTCSRVVEESSFQNLLALSYALEKVNANSTILPEIQLGALVFDHCGRRQKAEEQIFSFIASDGSLPYSEAGLRSRAMVAALTYDPLVAEDLSPLFESVLIPQIATPAGLVPALPARQKRRSSRSAEELPMNMEVRVVADILNWYDWKFVTLLHSGSESERNIFWNFVEVAKERKICISKSLVIKPEIQESELSALFSEELDPKGESKVIILLLEDPLLLKNTLEAAKKASIIEEFVWIGIESEKDGRVVAKTLQGVETDFFLIRPETYEVPGFREYYSGFTLSKHGPIPDVWFEEFWQHHFRCHLPQSIAPLKKLFPEPCRGTESLTSQPLSQDTFVYHTVSAVTTVAEALHDYLRRYCVHGDAATNLEDCGTDARQLLWREMRKFVKGPPVSCIDGDCGPLKISVGYQIFQLRKAKIHHVYQQVGLWKDGNLALKLEDVHFTSGGKVDSKCRQHCQKCIDQLALDPEELNLPKPSLYANFRTMWGVIISALSILGVLLVIICAAYFLISFQVTVGTTILGYKILFGLLLLYAVNFAFVLAPTEGTCGVRRFGLGLAYSIIFSGMLVKVMNIWRMMGYRGNQFLGDPSYHVTSPAALLVVAVGLVIIQVILSSAWLILIPPKTGIHNGEWRCHPATTFEDELIISLVYVMLMLAITILFSILTWGSKDNNRESRWIFTCCFMITLVWVAWTVISTQILHQYRDLTISMANLVCASVVMLCMYLRKVYIYNKLTKDQEKKAKLQQTMPLPPVPNMYGTISRTGPSITPVTAYQSGPRVVGIGGKVLERTPPSRMALINPEDGNSSDSGSGSVQVQATDLYPLDMYDGGSQFQPSSLRLGGSSLVLDEAATNHGRS